MYAKTVLFAALALVATLSAAADREKCVEKFEAEAYSKGWCSVGQCWGGEDGTLSVDEVCGKRKLTKEEKKEILGSISSTCYQYGNGDFDDLIKNDRFSRAETSWFNYISAEEARAACAKRQPSTSDILAEQAKKRQDAMVITIGSTEEMLITKFGKPEKINTTVTSGLVRKQYVYGSTLIYLDNGVITAFQQTSK